MSSISRTDAAHAVSRTNRVDARARTRSGSTTPENVQAPAGGVPFDFEEDVTRRVAEIGADDPDRRQHVRRAFLESCVARTFGRSAPQDPAFRQVIDQATDAIATDPQLAAAMERVTDRLCAPPSLRP
jgi:hypothetical protein